MAKQKLSITVDANLVDAVDRMAKDRDINRSECIERLLAEALGDTGWWEFIRLRSLPSEIKRWMAHSTLSDDDGPCEMVLRVTAEEKREWLEKRSGKRGQSNRQVRRSAK